MFSATAGWLRHFTRLRSAHPNPVIVTVPRHKFIHREHIDPELVVIRRCTGFATQVLD